MIKVRFYILWTLLHHTILLIDWFVCCLVLGRAAAPSAPLVPAFMVVITEQC